MNQEIQAVLKEMRERKVNGQNQSATLVAWADRIEAALPVATEVAAMDAIVEAYNNWPADIRKKLSLHDLRRMSGWTPPAAVSQPATGDSNAMRPGTATESATLCGVLGCNNKATHTWSGHPTCDACGSPTRKVPKR